MAELNSKQKKQLRALGQRLDAIATVGKAGLSEGVIAGINLLLDQHELIKVNVPAGPERHQMAQELSKLTNSVLVGLVGRMAVLYRPNPALPENKRVYVQ